MLAGDCRSSLKRKHMALPALCLVGRWIGIVARLLRFFLYRSVGAELFPLRVAKRVEGS